MEKKLFLKAGAMAFLGFGVMLSAQEKYDGKLGLNTDTPKATMDIQPSSENAKETSTTKEGLLIPRLSKKRLANIESPEKSTLVYVNNITYTGTDTKVSEVKSEGFYYYNGTKWVSTDSNLWAQRTDNGVIKTYLKPAEGNNDVVSYGSNRKITFNLGGVTENDLLWHRGSGVKGYVENTIPFAFLSSSDTLPKEGFGTNKEYYSFFQNNAIIKEGHVSKVKPNSIYQLSENRVVAKDITSTLGSIYGANSSVDLFSNNKVDNVIGGAGVVTVGTPDSTYRPALENAIGGRFSARNYASGVERLYGMRAIVHNFGQAKTIRGVASEVATQTVPRGGSNTPHNVEGIIGIDNYVNIAPQATASYSYNQKNNITLNENSTSERVRGTIQFIATESGAKATTLIGHQSVSNIKSGSTITSYEDYSTYSTVEAGANIDTYKAFNFYPQAVTGGTIKKMYGLHIGNVEAGSEINRAIHTESGDIRFGSLKSTSTGYRQVYVDKDGVLKAGTNASQTLAQLWEKDSNNGNIKLVGRDDVSIDNTGSLLASSFVGKNGASIFPDYVFQKYYTGDSTIKPDYTFASLSQVENFVKQNGHLPGYKSAEAIKKQGYIDLMDTQLKNVEKIEELYLHTIEQDKKLKEKDAEIAELKSRLERLEKLLVE